MATEEVCAALSLLAPVVRRTTRCRAVHQWVLKSTLAVTGPIVPSTAPLRVGGNGICGEYFKGLIDDVRIYKRALSETEIKADMGTPVP